MLGQMMNEPLLISGLVKHAARYHGSTEIVSVETAGGVYRTNWRDVELDSCKLTSALQKLCLKKSDRCATIAWNNYLHLEIYFGVSGSGLFCHTINPHLFPERMIYIFNHAEDQVLFFDKTFLPQVAKLRAHFKTVKAFILMGPRDEEASNQFEGLHFFDELVASGENDYLWPVLDEQTGSSLCYTSGMTGNPKDGLYSHLSTVLHSFAAVMPDGLNISAKDTMHTVVPMFHVNTRGTPFAAAMVGTKLVLAGPGLDGDSLIKLIDDEQVTLALGVPTIWQGLLVAAAQNGTKFESLQRTVVGGSACPPSTMNAFRELYGVEIIHAWGMTETSQLATASQLLQKNMALGESEQNQLRQSQGRPFYGVELKMTGDDGAMLPEDGKAQGDLSARGDWIFDSYFKTEAGTAKTGDRFTTDDVATVDPDGFMTIRDRSKDIIKSGGEWISSVELEGIAVGHSELIDAAVIGAKHEKWDERAVLIAVKAPGTDPSPASLIAFFDSKIAKWQIPDAVVFTDAIARNATGKILKNKLRELYDDCLLK